MTEEVHNATATVLLIDDEKVTRHLMERVLIRHGYALLSAVDGESGLKLYRDHEKDIDLIILDLLMPGMGGSRCLEQLQRLNPQVKVIVTSGRQPEGRLRDAIQAGAIRFLEKPFQIKEALRVIGELLEESRTDELPPDPAPGT